MLSSERTSLVHSVGHANGTSSCNKSGDSTHRSVVSTAHEGPALSFSGLAYFVTSDDNGIVGPLSSKSCHSKHASLVGTADQGHV